jgi:dTDP-4-dehydrorhamnose reductase
MKVLLTGMGGQLGQALIKTKPKDIGLVPLDRRQLDIADSRAIECTLVRERPQIIINAAAYTAVDKAEAEPALAFSVNRDAVGQLGQVAAETGIRFVHVSTDFVFDGTSSQPYPPKHPTTPLGIYGHSKAAGEELARAASPDNLIVRTSWVYGATGRNFMMTMLDLMRAQKSPRVVADQIGTPTHAVSLARAIWSLTVQRASGIHHWSDAGVASWYDFAVAIREEAIARGLVARHVKVTPVTTADYPTPAVRPQFSVLDKSETWSLIGNAAHWREELRLALDELEK